MLLPGRLQTASSEKPLEGSSGQTKSDLVGALLQTAIPTVVVAMRTPYDLVGYPTAPTYVCSYGILPSTLDALAVALFEANFPGRIPVSIPGLYPVGHGLGASTPGSMVR